MGVKPGVWVFTHSPHPLGVWENGSLPHSPHPVGVWENGGRKGELKRFIFLLSPPIGSAEGGGGREPESPCAIIMTLINEGSPGGLGRRTHKPYVCGRLLVGYE